MRTRAKGTSRAAVLAAGFVALGVTAIPSNAFADVTTGDGGVLSGNQIEAPISAPVDVSGNGAALLGTGHATSQGGAKVNKQGAGGQQTSGRHGVVSGNQVNAPISLPVNVCGNAVGIAGQADAGCTGGAEVSGGEGRQTTDGTRGVIAGNQVNAPISVPVNVCGNAVAIAGDAVAGCEGGSLVQDGGNYGSGQETSGIFGVGAGNQGNIPISVPVDVCGNTVGNGAASCEGGASVHNGGHLTGRQTTDGAFGIISGNQANAPISVPVTACGNAAALVGEAWSFCEGGAHVHGSSGGDQHTSGVHGVLAGNQGNAPISIPVEVCGDAAAVAGQSAASCNGHTYVEGSHGSGTQTSGDHGPGSGNQANTPIQTPADACGNSAAIAGIAPALCDDGYGYGGYYPSSRTLLPLPQTTFPALSNVVSDPTTNTLPQVDGVSTENGLPKLLALPSTGNRRTQSGVPAVDGVLPSNTLPEVDGVSTAVDLPKLSPASNRRFREGLPTKDGVVAGNTLPQVGGVSTVADLTRMNGLPKLLALPSTGNRRTQSGVPATDGVLPSNTLPEVDGVPTENGLPKLLALPSTGNRRTQSGVPATDGVLPSNTLPEVDGVSTENALPKLPALPSTGNRRTQSGVPATDGVLPSNVLPQVDGVSTALDLPKLSPASNRRARAGVPVTDGVVAKNTLPAVDGVSTVGGLTQRGGLTRLLVLPSTRGGVPGLPSVGNRRVRGGVPGAGGVLPGNALVGGVPWVRGLGTDGLLSGTGGVVPTKTLPKVDGSSASGLLKPEGRRAQAGVPALGGRPVRGLPVAGGVPGSAVGGTRTVLSQVDRVTGGSVVPVAGEIGPVRNVAAAEPVGDEDGSMWAFAASGVLGLLAGALALARRVRLGGRR